MLAVFSSSAFATTIVSTNGTWTITPDGRGIKISFKADSTHVTCAKIGLIQTVKITLYDAAGNGTVVNPADLSPHFAHLGDDTVGGTVVDHLWCEKDGEYNGDDNPQDKPNKQGSSGAGAATTSSDMKDYPYIGNGILRKAGKSRVVMEFEVCAVCMTPPVTTYDCIKWKYERDTTANDDGSSSLVSVAPAAETPAHAAAVAKFSTNHTAAGVAICPEEQALINSFSKLYDLLGPLWFKANQPFEVISAGGRVKKGPAAPTSSLPVAPIGTAVAPTDYVFVPSGDRICLRRTGIIPSTDPQIPFVASFSDLYFGSQESVETGVASSFQHTGIRVKNCSGTTLCAAAPVSSTNTMGHVMFTAKINNTTQQVTFKNNSLSTHAITCKDVLHNLSVATLNPGDSLVYSFPGQVPSCVSTLNLKLFIQGYMNGSGGSMGPVLYNQGQEAKVGECDSIDVQLRAPYSPFQVMQSTRAVLRQDGTASCTFSPTNQQYFIAVKHRNAVETWSANPIQLQLGTVLYDFSNAASKAFGANQIAVAPGVWAFYSGDISQDQSIDLLDMPIYEAAVNSFTYGYSPSDLNGDGSVDLLDYPLLEANINNFIFSNQPN